MRRILLAVVSCIWINITLSQEIIVNQKFIDSLRNDETEQMGTAILNPIVKKIYMPDCADDYIEQHYYPNGQMYFQVPIKNGKRNGMYLEYYPNGQFKYAIPVKDGEYVKDYCRMNSISYDFLGNIETCTLYVTITDTIYKFVLSGLTSSKNPHGPCYSLYVYKINENPQPELVSQFSYFDKKWEKSYIHTIPAKNSKQLLKAFIKELKSFNYKNFMNIEI